MPLSGFTSFPKRGDVMSATWKARMPLAVLAAVVVAAVILMARSATARADREPGATAGSRYSVVETEAHNLIVTDNQNNTLYFYTIDKDKEVGSELKLRGTIDLNQVGKPVIKPVKANQE
jgi:hypothetical protein